MENLIVIRVIVPVKLAWEPTYSTTDETLKVGDRVRVKLAGKELTGVVSEINAKPDVAIERIQPILSVERQLEPVTENEIRFWRFLSSYYMCSIGEVFKAAYPAGRISTEKQKARKKLKTEVRERCGTINPEILEDRTLLRCPDREREKNVLFDNIREAFQCGDGHILFLVPDKTALKRWERLLSGEFGDRLLVYSHEVGAATKREEAKAVRLTPPKVVLGLRSAIFLPFSKLSLVVVTDEEDAAYKQSKPAPRYNGRDAAIVLARQFAAKLILSSPTPSLESLYNCRIGKLILADIHCSKGSLTVIDTSAEKRKRGMDGELSLKARMRMEAAMQQGRNVFVITPADIRKTAFTPGCVIVLQMAELLVKKDDFRADERALQTIMRLRYQCAELLVQTSQGSHPVFAMEDAAALLEERRLFDLPPFKRMMKLSVRCSNPARIFEMQEALSREFGGNLNLLLPSDGNLSAAKTQIAERIRCFEKKAGHGVSVAVDVDPA